MPRDSIPPLFSVLTIVGLIAGGAYSLFQYFEISRRGRERTKRMSFRLQLPNSKRRSRFMRNILICVPNGVSAERLKESRKEDSPMWIVSLPQECVIKILATHSGSRSGISRFRRASA
jgi:hypothetical protein